MQCPYCKKTGTQVIDSRSSEDGSVIRRRRKCPHCSERFTTYEKVSISMPVVIKKHGNVRVPYSQEKLKASMDIALRKRAVKASDLEAAIDRIEQELRLSGEKEIATVRIGELVMRELERLDKVAYVRYASVYLNYSTLDDFSDAIQKLGH